MKIAVTAASGHLGSTIITTLLDKYQKEDIIALARTPKNAEHLGVEVRAGDYDNAEQLEKSLQGVDNVLLISGMDEPEKRIAQHRNVINAAKKNGVEKIVYTSIQGAEEGNAFSPVVRSNRQTEEDIKACGLNWAIGRNGLYIEPDLEYIDNYKKAGIISNCAGDGLCGYTTRDELACAYAHMISDDKHNSHTYNLHGEAITQRQLAKYLNYAFSTHLEFINMSVEAYQTERQAQLGKFLGTVIAGIYQSIRTGKFNNPSHFKQACGRSHISWEDYFLQIKQHHNPCSS